MKNNKSHFKKIGLLVVFLVLGVAFGKFFFSKNSGEPKPNVGITPTPSPQPQNPTPAPQPAPTPIPSPTPTSIPKTLLLKVPFTSQAPTANWDDPIYAEGCEEASSVMAAEYFKGNRVANLPTDFALAEIKRLADWEMEKFGYNLDINSEQTASMIEEVYGLNTEILNSFSENQLKQFLTDGKIVLFPSDGRLLNNPNYKSPGPPYHMLVIKGFDSMGFITNDPGTRKGLNYPYTFNTLYSANGNYHRSEHEVNLNEKTIIVVWK